MLCMFILPYPPHAIFYPLSLHERSSDLRVIRRRTLGLLGAVIKPKKAAGSDQTKKGQPPPENPKGGSLPAAFFGDRKSTRLNSSHRCISYDVFWLKEKIKST